MISSITSAFSYYLTPSKTTPKNSPSSTKTQTTDDWVKVDSLTPYLAKNLADKIEALKKEKLSHITYGTGRKISSKELRALDQTLSSIQRKIIQNQKNSSL